MGASRRQQSSLLVRSRAKGESRALALQKTGGVKPPVPKKSSDSRSTGGSLGYGKRRRARRIALRYRLARRRMRLRMELASGSFRAVAAAKKRTP